MVHIFQVAYWLPSSKLADKKINAFLYELYEQEKIPQNLSAQEQKLIKMIDSHIHNI